MMLSKAAFALFLAAACDAASLRSHVKPVVHSSMSVSGSKVYRQELINFQNTQYYGKFDIAGQDLLGIFDTGSFELLVLSERCKTCKKKSYSSGSSDTYKKNGTITQHVFGSGPVVSMQGYDTISVGPMKAASQSFWEIMQHQIAVLDHAKFDAIVGMGVGLAPNNPSEKTLLMNFGVEQFSVCLERKSQSPGWIYWGETHSKKELASDFATVPVAGKIHWAAQMKEMRMGFSDGRMSEIAFCQNGCAAIIDTGTSLIAAPSAMLAALSPLVGNVAQDCSNLNELPSLLFKMGDSQFELPPAAYIMKLKRSDLKGQGAASFAQGMSLYFAPKDTDKTDKSSSHVCMPAFMTMNKKSQLGDVLIMGMPFFRYYYSTFDRPSRSMLFAKAKPDCKSEKYEAPKWFKNTAMLQGESKMSMFEQAEEPMDFDWADAVAPSWAEGTGMLEV